MRIDGGKVHAHGFELIASGQHQAGECRNRGSQKLQIRAEIGDGFRFHGKNGAVLLDRDLVIADLIAAMNGCGRILATALDPFDRRIQPHRQVANQCFLGVEVELGAEPTPNFGRDDAQFVFRHTDHAGQKRADEVGDLRRSPERDCSFPAMMCCHATARLDGHRNQTLMDHAQLDDAIGLLEFAVDVASGERPIERDIGAQFRMRERRILFESLLGFANNRERIVIDFDQIQRIARDIPILGHDDGDRMPDKVDAVGGEHRVLRGFLVWHWGSAWNESTMFIHVRAG